MKEGKLVDIIDPKKMYEVNLDIPDYPYFRKGQLLKISKYELVRSSYKTGYVVFINFLESKKDINKVFPFSDLVIDFDKIKNYIKAR